MLKKASTLNNRCAKDLADISIFCKVSHYTSSSGFVLRSVGSVNNQQEINIGVVTQKIGS